MIESVEVVVKPKHLQDIDHIFTKALKKSRYSRSLIQDWEISKRSIDARGNHPLYRLRISLYIDESKPQRNQHISTFTIANPDKKVIVIGAGPAGYFAALQLIKHGITPIVLERGKDVRSRRRDLKAIQQEHIVNPHSNYCFGEGGAGTYSDGKLYTRSHKRGNIQEILEILVEHGAKEDILIDAHPHIGSNKLPAIISSMRETIEKFGGQVQFDTHIVDFELAGNQIIGAVDSNGVSHHGLATILATGHSARDIFELLDSKNFRIEPKPFAVGVRIEHPQSTIDHIQYGQAQREEHLPAASYRVVNQVNEVGVFSFCMCPGGLIVPASTAPGEIVVNGMSLSKRDSPYANSGFVTAISNEEILHLGYRGLLANMHFQRDIEQVLFKAGDGSQRAPAQRMTDFTNGKVSESLNSSSYIPGLYPTALSSLLPHHIADRLSKGMEGIGKKMKGFYTREANVVGIESRTSSPVRIPRDSKTLMHDVIGLFPCGEGAGYAGGILSAAIDGRRVAEAISAFLD